MCFRQKFVYDSVTLVVALVCGKELILNDFSYLDGLMVCWVRSWIGNLQARFQFLEWTTILRDFTKE